GGGCGLGRDVMPLGHESARDAAVPQTGKIVSTKRHQHWWRATIFWLPCPLRTVKKQSIGQEQDAARPFPDRLEPSSLGARMEQRRAMAMLGKATDPSLNLVAIEWRIQPRPAKPLLTETVVAFGIIDASAIPRARVGSGRIEIERAEHLDDPARRDVNLGLADAGLMRSQRHGAARRRHSGMSSPSPARGSTATSPTRALNFSRAPCDAQSHARSRLRSSLSSPSSSHWGLRTAFNSPTSPRSAMFWNSKCVSWACSSS